ncbi:hypothetical protein PRN20_19965 [Devosia sp. ZB163]|uniref:hypothetical protein n=1 Tax=Devosia sp. ZB163 TaxID=3025938 RepID=UPI002360C4C6|nr:hypothetical protein [Devosia sp. ZB163]MDC9826019.1 hypothetical protein [Devosia sp. ZB163]
MRRIVSTLLLVVGFTGGAAAYDTPKALVEAIYQPYTSGQNHDGGLQHFYSERLKGLYSASVERHASEEAGADAASNAADVLAFDPFIEANHTLLFDLVINEPVVSGDRAVATVRFHNFDHLSLISVSMVKEADGWKVDDVASLGGSQNWLLSWLLQYDPFALI